MSTNIIRGSIQKCNQKTAYDNDGNEYKQTWITVNGTEYSAKLPKDLYLEVGMEVLLESKGDSPSEITSGYCVKMDHHWGNNWKALKGQLGPEDRYTYMEGKVTEKRKSTDGAFDMTRSINSQTRISYTILLGDQQFHASQDQGEWLQIGMEIACVRIENDVVLILDKRSGKLHQVTRPYYLLFFAFIPVLVAVKMYQVQAGSEVPPTYALVVLAIFFVLAGVLNLVSYRAYLPVKRFLLRKSAH